MPCHASEQSKLNYITWTILFMQIRSSTPSTTVIFPVRNNFEGIFGYYKIPTQTRRKVDLKLNNGRVIMRENDSFGICQLSMVVRRLMATTEAQKYLWNRNILRVPHKFVCQQQTMKVLAQWMNKWLNCWRTSRDGRIIIVMSGVAANYHLKTT